MGVRREGRMVVCVALAGMDSTVRSMRTYFPSFDYFSVSGGRLSVLHPMMRGMSLTSELSNPNSPLVRFLARELPMASRVIGSLRGRLPLWPPTVRPQAAVPPDYRSLGRAIDRRLRVAFGSPVDSVLHGGVFLAGVDVAEATSGAAGQAVHSVGQALLSELKGQPMAHGGSLTRSGAEEDRLGRLCFAASHFEEVFRAGLRPGNPLLRLEACADLEDLLDQVPSYVPRDITRQVELAEGDHALGWVTRLPVQERICAPVFDGSDDVGGADADFIVDGHLIDCKATVRPERFGDKGEVLQLAGYLLLDYEDRYRLHTVCFYLARQGQLVTWTIQEFLGLLGARRSLPELREALRRELRDPAASPNVRQPGPSCGIQESLFSEDAED
ncbi:hypothetical protein [Streptomyces sp. NPDC047097]|uniref:hypothetical protein n=1 Tax=Streptomyces sp. NPDC047097 TaxID=3155260 RepID=UPI0033E6D0BF